MKREQQIAICNTIATSLSVKVKYMKRVFTVTSERHRLNPSLLIELTLDNIIIVNSKEVENIPLSLK